VATGTDTLKFALAVVCGAVRIVAGTAPKRTLASDGALALSKLFHLTDGSNLQAILPEHISGRDFSKIPSDFEIPRSLPGI
jgi:hypothetical protein